METASQSPVVRNLTPAEFNEMLAKRPGAVLIDVRTPAEIYVEALEGAVAIDFLSPDFAQRIAALDKAKPYLVYCRSGNRSGQACQFMRQQGFAELYNLSGGLMNWPY